MLMRCNNLKYEMEHDKTTKWPVCQVKTQISLSIHPAWSLISRCCLPAVGLGHWLPIKHTGKALIRMPNLIQGFNVHTGHYVGLSCPGSLLYQTLKCSQVHISRRLPTKQKHIPLQQSSRWRGREQYWGSSSSLPGLGHSELAWYPSPVPTIHKHRFNTRFSPSCNTCTCICKFCKWMNKHWQASEILLYSPIFSEITITLSSRGVCTSYDC